MRRSGTIDRLATTRIGPVNRVASVQKGGPA